MESWTNKVTCLSRRRQVFWRLCQRNSWVFAHWKLMETLHAIRGMQATNSQLHEPEKPSVTAPACTSILHFGRIPVQMGLATLCPKHAKSAAQSIPNHPPKPGVSSSTNPNVEYRRLKSRDNPHSHTLFYRRYDHTEPVPFFLSLLCHVPLHLSKFSCRPSI